MINLWIDFQDLLKVKNTAFRRQRSNNYLEIKKKKKCFGEDDAVTLTMLYLKVLHDNGFTKSFNKFFRSSHHVLEIYVLNTGELSNVKFSYTLRTTIL